MDRLNREFFYCGVVVLLAADFAVALGGGFEEFVAAIGGEGAHAFSGGSQLLRWTLFCQRGPQGLKPAN
jgi:hypothetical protein